MKNQIEWFERFLKLNGVEIIKVIIRCERHRIKIPVLVWVRLKEKGYIPANSQTHIIKSGTVSHKVRKLEKKLEREQRKLSRKYESFKKSNNNLKGVAARQNIQKQKLKVQKIYHTLNNIRSDYINKVIAGIAKTKPSYIAIEDLNVSGMMKNRHLAKAVAQQKFFWFRTKLRYSIIKQNAGMYRWISIWIYLSIF